MNKQLLKKKPLLSTNETSDDFVREAYRAGQFRCQHCKKRLADGCIGSGTCIEIKCPRCGKVVSFSGL